MAIDWKLESQHMGMLRVSGVLGVAQLAGAQAGIGAAVQSSGAFSMLVLLQGFEGWSSEQGWEDTSFTDDNDDQIKKMAFVGVERWRDLIYAFTLRGLRPVDIEYFESEAEARAWLSAD